MDHQHEEENVADNNEVEERTAVEDLQMEMLADIFGYFSPLFTIHILQLVSKRFQVVSQFNNLAKHVTFDKYEMGRYFVHARQIPKYLIRLDRLRTLTIQAAYLKEPKVVLAICKLKKSPKHAKINLETSWYDQPVMKNSPEIEHPDRSIMDMYKLKKNLVPFRSGFYSYPWG